MKTLSGIIAFFILSLNCYAQCPPGQTLCGGICVDLSSDANHCGACGNACPPGKFCVGGICSTCPTGSVDCSGNCVDTNTNANHCGGCGNICPPGYSCDGGSCKPGTSTGFLLLNNDPSSISVFPNPVSDVVTIRAEELSNGKVIIKLLDSKGSLVSDDLHEHTVFDQGTLNIHLPVNMASGLYFIHIASKQFNKILKINKE